MTYWPPMTCTSGAQSPLPPVHAGWGGSPATAADPAGRNVSCTRLQWTRSADSVIGMMCRVDGDAPHWSVVAYAKYFPDTGSWKT
jgi:hypothetical protein